MAKIAYKIPSFQAPPPLCLMFLHECGCGCESPHVHLGPRSPKHNPVRSCGVVDDDDDGDGDGDDEVNDDIDDDE